MQISRKLQTLLKFRMVATASFPEPTTPIEKAKKQAAYSCAQKHVQSGCRLGVGSGSTVKYLVEYLSENYSNGNLKNIVCVPTSFQTKQWLLDARLPVSDLDAHPELDVCIDGADEVDSHFNCIKGGGGCLAQEKIVQCAAKQFFVIADFMKDSKQLGDHYSVVPIEILPLAAQPLLRSIPREFGGNAQLRQAVKKCGPIVTDNGNLIIDWNFEKNRDDRNWAETHAKLVQKAGVVETGLFFDVVHAVFFAYSDGSVKELINPKFLQ